MDSRFRGNDGHKGTPDPRKVVPRGSILSPKGGRGKRRFPGPGRPFPLPAASAKIPGRIARFSPCRSMAAAHCKPVVRYHRRPFS